MFCMVVLPVNQVVFDGQQNTFEMFAVSVEGLLGLICFFQLQAQRLLFVQFVQLVLQLKQSSLHFHRRILFGLPLNFPCLARCMNETSESQDPNDSEKSRRKLRDCRQNGKGPKGSNGDNQ